jgi:hypothetical protein
LRGLELPALESPDSGALSTSGWEIDPERARFLKTLKSFSA